MTVAVVHLVRAANGPEPLERFLEAYEAHDREEDVGPLVFVHWLIFACKGFPTDRAALERIGGHDALYFPDVGYDIGTYRRCAERAKHDVLVFVNSFSRPLVDDWLGIMVRALDDQDIGLVGCTGSWEGIEGSPFPNPHVRTNAFAMRRDLFLSLDLPEPQTKRDASLLEAGPSSITRQVLARDLRAVVVNADGSIYDVRLPGLHFSRTFRYGGQTRLLVADNRTDDYADRHTLAELRHLEEITWGKT